VPPVALDLPVDLDLAAPAQLWWLLLWPMLYWLALPPPPRQRGFSPHLRQWQLAQQSLRRRSPRLSFWRWLLLAVATGALTLALAGPSLPAQPGVERLVVLLDASASMAATDEGVRRFDQALAITRAQLAAVPEGIDITVLRCGGAPARRHGPAARGLLDLGEPGGAATADLATLAAEIADERTAVLVVTDGQGQQQLPTVGGVQLVGRAADNAAVLWVAVDDGWPLPGLQLDVEVVAFGRGVLACELLVDGAIEPYPSRVLALSPGETRRLTLPLQRRPEGGWLRVRLQTEGDALPDDDSWQALLPPLPAPRLGLLAAPDAAPFAAAAAQALAAEFAGEVVPATPGTAVGLLLVEGGAIDLLPGTGRMLAFGARHRGAAQADPLLQPGALTWDRDDPLLAGLDLADLRVEAADPATVPAGQELLWAQPPGRPAVPLLSLVAGAEGSTLHFGFRLEDSNLALLPAFPQLLRRAMLRSYGAAAGLSQLGQPPAPGEQDLRHRHEPPPPQLPCFARPAFDLAPWLLVLAAVALALRACCR